METAPNGDCQEIVGFIPEYGNSIEWESPWEKRHVVDILVDEREVSCSDEHEY